MERSGFLTLNWRDFLRGLLGAVISAVVTFLYELFQSGAPVFDSNFFKNIGVVAISALLAYVAKNLFENKEGTLLKKDG